MKTGPGQTILLFTTLEAGKKLGTLGWVEGTTKTPKDRGRDDKDTDKEDKENWKDTKRSGRQEEGT